MCFVVISNRRREISRYSRDDIHFVLSTSIDVAAPLTLSPGKFSKSQAKTTAKIKAGINRTRTE